MSVTQVLKEMNLEKLKQEDGRAQQYEISADRYYSYVLLLKVICNLQQQRTNIYFGTTHVGNRTFSESIP